MADNMRFEVSAEDKATQVLKDVNKQVNGLSDSVTNNQGKISTRAKSNEKIFTNMRNYGAIAFAWLTAGITSVAVASAKQLETAEAYERMTKNMWIAGQDMMKEMRMASKWTIDDNNLLLAANKAMSLGVIKDSKEMTTILEIARVKSKNMGTDLQSAFADIVVGLGRGSPLILDNLGIVLDSEQAYLEYAGAMWKAVTELTNAEKKQAIINNVVNNGRKELEAMGEIQLTSAERWAQMTTTISNAKNRLGNAFLPVLEKVVSALTPIIDKLSLWIESNPEWTSAIWIIATALAWLVASLWTLGLILPKVIAGMNLLKTAMLTNPIVLFATALVGLMVALKKASEALPTYASQMEWYKNQIAWLTEQYNLGAISQEEYNKKVWELNTEMQALEERSKTLWWTLRNDFAETLNMMANPIESTKEAFNNFWIIVNAVGDWFDRLVNIIMTGLINWFNNTVLYLTNITTFIRSTVSGRVNYISTQLRNLWVNIGNIFTNIRDTMVNLINETVNTVMSVFDNMVVGIRNIWNNLMSEAFNRGKNLIQMIINGISSMVNSLVSKVKSVASKVTDYLGFHSPTKEGPGSDADEWAPNFMKMFWDWFTNNIWYLEKSISWIPNTIKANVMPASITPTTSTKSSNWGVVYNVTIEKLYWTDKQTAKNFVNDVVGEFQRQYLLESY